MQARSAQPVPVGAVAAVRSPPLISILRGRAAWPMKRLVLCRPPSVAIERTGPERGMMVILSVIPPGPTQRYRTSSPGRRT